MTTIFKAYDVRGVVPDELDADWARAIGAAFVGVVGAERVIVGHDMRLSSEELKAAVIDGITAMGAAAIDLGLASTDLLFFASGTLDLPAVMITASHNPGGYNGLKLCRAGARPVGAESGLVEIEELATGYRAKGLPARPVRGTVESRSLLDEYVAHVRSFVAVERLRGLKIVADTANGMGGLVVPPVFEGLGVSLELLYGELDGSFPNHPADPIQPENLVDLRARVLAAGADVGLAFDGDADRVFLVDDQAAPMSGSTTTALIAVRALARHPGATILYNLICSKAVPELIVEHGGVPVRTRVGHSFIKAEMARTGAVFGGEHSGHYYFRDNFRADSGIIAALHVLEAVATEGKPLSELRRELERYAGSGEINSKVRDPAAVLSFVENAYAGRAKADHLDGLTLDFGDWWFNLRPSNTEPLLRLNLEARTPDEVFRHSQEVLAVIAKAEAGSTE
jgi:phosphomannomutase